MPHSFEQLHRFLERYQRFVIAGHSEPDGDCLCSQMALASILIRRKKEVQLLSPGPFKRPEILEYADRFSQSLDPNRPQPEAAVVLDCSTIDRIGTLAEIIQGVPTAIVDHHASGEPFGDVRIIDPSAPSVTFLINRYMHEIGEVPNEEESTWLLFGLCTDTGFFRHLGGGSQDAFRAAADLIESGAAPKELYLKMYGSQSFLSRRLVGRLLERTESHFDGQLLLTWQTADDVRAFDGERGDSDAVYQQLQLVSRGRVIVFIRSEGDGKLSVGLRSLTSPDVGVVARNFGGGGHPNAAGYDSEGSIADEKQRIITAMEPLLKS